MNVSFLGGSPRECTNVLLLSCLEVMDCIEKEIGIAWLEPQRRKKVKPYVAQRENYFTSTIQNYTLFWFLKR